MNFLSLFTGVGMIDYGLEQAGMKCVGQCEADEFCQAVLSKHWPEVPIIRDVKLVDTAWVRANCGSIDLVCGGFPCQDVSVAGRGKGLDGERSGLWYEMRRVIAGVRPRWVLVENVPRLRTLGADAVLASLEELGYSCWPTVVGAWAVGAPHKRDRVWIIGRLADSAGVDRERRSKDAERQKAEREAVDGPGDGLADAGCPPQAQLADGSPSRQPQSIVPSHGRRWPVGPGQIQHEWEHPRVRTADEERAAALKDAESELGGPTDGLPGWVARLAVRRRKARLRAIGNAVVWQIPFLLGQAILAIEAEAANA